MLRASAAQLHPVFFTQRKAFISKRGREPVGSVRTLRAG
jgi:hypothetical protein